MRCPRCRDEKHVEQLKSGMSKLDYILACWLCSWQVAARNLKTWMDKWNR